LPSRGDTAEQSETTDEPGSIAPVKKYGTFEGVFIPTMLTILGVIMYLREGFVVGNAGFGGAVLIIVLAFTITGSTALSMSSVITNIRIGPGGAYSLISRSLGVEVGGAIGVPLYLSQALAAAMYIFGFREGWQNLFPDHNALIVDLVVFVVVFAVAAISTGLVFRIQFLIMAMIVASLISVGATLWGDGLDQPLTFWGDFAGEGGQGTNFWLVFAIFFPAATGIMAGANMSGVLADPRRSIPVGTLGAIGVSFVVYLALAFWLAKSASPEELLSNPTFMIDRAAWRPAMLAGVLGATLSSALSSVAGAPRVLRALGRHRVVPQGTWFAALNRKGEPMNAMAVTAAVVLAALLLRNLNAIAPLLTMFFLITYAMINTVAFVEDRLGLMSFRPIFRVPRVVPLMGAIGSVVAMFIINPLFSLVGVAVVIGIYLYIVQRELPAPFGDVRSGLFLAISEWAVNKARSISSTRERVWKPNVLVPITRNHSMQGCLPILETIAGPEGSVRVLGFATKENTLVAKRVERVSSTLVHAELMVSDTVIEHDDPRRGFSTALATLEATYTKPNLIFLNLHEDDAEEVTWEVEKAIEHDLGVLVFETPPEGMAARIEIINLWVPIPEVIPEPGAALGLGDLAVLMAYKVALNEDAKIRMLGALPAGADLDEAKRYLGDVADLARLRDPELEVLTGFREDALEAAPDADLTVMRIGDWPISALPDRVASAGGACIFTRDSGHENAFA